MQQEIPTSFSMETMNPICNPISTRNAHVCVHALTCMYVHAYNPHKTTEINPEAFQVAVTMLSREANGGRSTTSI